jgi:hypothetical protein
VLEIAILAGVETSWEIVSVWSFSSHLQKKFQLNSG